MNKLESIEFFEKFSHGMTLFSQLSDFSVGTTPAEVVYTEDTMKLIHYIPTVKKPYAVPILVVYALVNRYYILDLQPDKSVMKKLLDEGFDVYVLDWGYPTGIGKYLTIDDHVNGYINNAVDKIREISAVDKITILGVCQGGTFSVMYAALHPEKVKNLITLVAPINFDTNKGLLHVWAKNLDVDRIVDYFGVVPGDVLNIGFMLADPFRTMIDKYVDLFERIEIKPGDEESQRKNEEMIRNFLRMEKWIFDSPDQPGETLRQFVKDCYQNNLLIKNAMVLNGQKINLKNITMPLLNVMAEFDHLVPNEASKPLNDAVSSSDKETLVFKTGHIGIFVGSKSQKEVCPKIAEWLRPRSIPDEAKKDKTVSDEAKKVKTIPDEVTKDKPTPAKPREQRRTTTQGRAQ
ncbi:MAG TPA: class III poly(R)-hydroxyalkanoic acid synthase subunit PhaC [Nitrososphaerales archaeon]